MSAQRRNKKYWEQLLSGKEGEIEHLDTKVKTLEEERESLREENKNKDTEIRNLTNDIESERSEVDNLSDENISLKKQIDIFQTKKLADAFEEAGFGYKGNRDKWLGATTFTALMAFAVSVLYFFYCVKYDISWESRLSGLTITGVVVYALYFCARQYSLYRNLFIDMKHRQVLAQSYYNVLRSVEDQEIRPLLASKVVEFITTPPHTKEDKMGTPLEIVANAVSGGMNKIQ